jgi:hypothetical protein
MLMKQDMCQGRQLSGRIVLMFAEFAAGVLIAGALFLA